MSARALAGRPARLPEDILACRIATGPAAAAFGMSEPAAGLLVPVPGPGGCQGRLEVGIDPAVLDMDPGRTERQQGLAAKEPLHRNDPPIRERFGIVVGRLSHMARVPQRWPGCQSATALLPRLPTRPATGMEERGPRATAGAWSPPRGRPMVGAVAPGQLTVKRPLYHNVSPVNNGCGVAQLHSACRAYRMPRDGLLRCLHLLAYTTFDLLQTASN